VFLFPLPFPTAAMRRRGIPYPEIHRILRNWPGVIA